MEVTVIERNHVLPSELTGSQLETYKELTMEADLSVRLSDVILSEENSSKIKQFLKERKYSRELIEKGLQPMNRILSYGVSGTGKTYSAKALANEMGCTMLMIDIAKALAQGNAADSISRIFKLANYMKCCLIFFDEVDAVAWNRDQSANDGGEIRRATNALFQYIDQMDSSNVFIACTNMLPRLDTAFARRFDFRLEFKRPELSAREQITKFMKAGFKLIDDVESSREDVVQKRLSASNFSYDEFKGVVHRALKAAVINESYEIHLKDVFEDLRIALRIADRSSRLLNTNDSENKDAE